ncbi:hypothetical protein MRX96_019349 [Rhipicephalus microplus]
MYAILTLPVAPIGKRLKQLLKVASSETKNRIDRTGVAIQSNVIMILRSSAWLSFYLFTAVWLLHEDGGEFPLCSALFFF